MDDSRFFISARDLYERLGTASAPLVIDVRRQPAFDADRTLLASAIHRLPEDIGTWGAAVPEGRSVVVYCVHGHEVSQNAASTLRARGIDARYLADGILQWNEQRLPIRNKLAMSGRWITRERPKIDRIACPWLVRRFIDPNAEFLYVPAKLVFETANESGAIAYDIPGAEPFSHDGDRCSFDAFIKAFGIEDAALDRLALIVRGADTGQPGLTAQSAGLLAISLGLSENYSHDDHAMLEQGMTIYDALYAWCRTVRDEGRRGEISGAAPSA
jgi:rhodanese-related sulfurtransferase